MAGPTFGVLLNADAKAETGGVVAGGPLRRLKADLNGITESLDFGISVGAGVRFPVGVNTLFLEGRYTFGLIDLIHGGTIEWKSGHETIIAEIGEKYEISTRGFQAMFGIIFPIGG